MSRVLMLVHAVADDPVHDAGGERRVDFRVVRDLLGAQVIDLADVSRSRLARAVRRLSGDYAALAVLAFLHLLRGRADAVLCDNENEALVLAVLLKLARRRTPLVTLAVYPGARKKVPFFVLARVQTHVDLWMTYNSVSVERLVVRFGVPPERVRLLPYYADERYFDPAGVEPDLGQDDRPYVLAVGRQHRDYRLLVEVAPDLPADVVIAVGSLYATTPDGLTGTPLPPGVRVVTLGYPDLRRALAGAAVVVIPTVEEEFSPGTTALLEAMAMGRPVVYTRAEGSGDYLADRRAVLRGVDVARPTRGLLAGLGAASDEDGAGGPHGFYVPVGDAAALRTAVTYLLEHPDEAEELGQRGRRAVEHAFTLDRYANGVTAGVLSVLSGQAAHTGTPMADRGAGT